MNVEAFPLLQAAIARHAGYAVPDVVGPLVVFHRIQARVLREVASPLAGDAAPVVRSVAQLHGRVARGVPVGGDVWEAAEGAVWSRSRQDREYAWVVPWTLVEAARDAALAAAWAAARIGEADTLWGCAWAAARASQYNGDGWVAAWESVHDIVLEEIA